MSAHKHLYRQYLLAVSRWPRDPLRPNISFREMLYKRVHAYFATHVAADAAIPTQNSPGPSAVEAGKPQLKFDRALAERELSVLGMLLEDKFKRAYPLGDTIRKPKSKPDYYDNLLRELQEAPKRNWWENKLNSFKGWIRMG